MGPILHGFRYRLTADCHVDTSGPLVVMLVAAQPPPVWAALVQEGLAGGARTPRRCGYCACAHEAWVVCPSYRAREQTRIMIDTTVEMILSFWGVSPRGWEREPVVDDHAEALPDDTTLPLDVWNAKVDALLAEVAAYQAALEKEHVE
jgi:hypothetical protein